MASSQAFPANRVRAANAVNQPAEARAATRARAYAAASGAAADAATPASVLAQLQTADGTKAGAALRYGSAPPGCRAVSGAVS